MRWVNDTLPPRPRRRWLLTTTRLSMRSLAGMARTLVAVGTPRLASMLETTRAAAPRRGRGAGASDVALSFASPSDSAFAAGAFAAGRAGSAGVFGAAAAGFGFAAAGLAGAGCCTVAAGLV